MESPSIEYTVDRSNYPPGPWDDEPEDKIVWIDSATDLDCMIVRQSNGFWCGYVGLPPGHKYHGEFYDDVPVDVHGGLTYSDACVGHVCHVAAEGRPDDIWWVGFDCAHMGDRIPRDFARDQVNVIQFLGTVFRTETALGDSRGTYKTRDWVRAETTQLAQQLGQAS